MLFKQTFKELENIRRDNAGFDLNYEEFKELCIQAGKDEDFVYLYIDRCKKVKVNIVIKMEVKFMFIKIGSILSKKKKI